MAAKPKKDVEPAITRIRDLIQRRNEMQLEATKIQGRIDEIMDMHGLKPEEVQKYLEALDNAGG